jgi:hypothetical protein
VCSWPGDLGEFEKNKKNFVSADSGNLGKNKINFVS